MHRSMNLDFNMLKPIAGLTASGAAYVANAVVATPDSFWLGLLKEVGLPTAMLICAVYGLYHLSKQIKELQTARVQDQKDILAQYREDMRNAEESRKTLIREMQEQTRAIKEKP